MDVSGLFSFFTKDKSGCFLMACFLLLFQLIVGAQALFLCFTKKSFLKILEVETFDSWWNFVPLTVSIGLALVVSIATIFFIVALLVDLHKGNTRLTKIMLSFSSIMLTVTILFCIVSEYAFDMNPIMYMHRILLLVFAFFPYMMSNYWVNLTENSQLYQPV